jgi:hypothetical protein
MRACALGALALAPATARAQYFGGGWGYFDPGYGVPGLAGPGYDFGVPGFTPGNSYALGAVDSLGIPGFTPGNSYAFGAVDSLGIPGFTPGNSYALGAIDGSPYFNMGFSPSGLGNNVAEWNGVLGNGGTNSEPRYRAKAKSRLRRKR